MARATGLGSAQPEASLSRNRIRAAGLRVTAPRVAVLNHLEKSHAPMSHPELAEALAPLGWDRATIYRNLIDLTEAGILRRADMGDHVWRFEMKRDRTHSRDSLHSDHHPHFVCAACGDVTCLPDAAVELHSSLGVPRALAGGELEIQLKGRCDGCL